MTENGLREGSVSAGLEFFAGGEKEGGGACSGIIASEPEPLWFSTVAAGHVWRLKRGWSELRCPGKGQYTQISKTGLEGKKSKTALH